MTDKTEQLDEFKASFGVNAEVPEPVDTGATKRAADKEQADPAPKATKAEMVADIARAAYKMSREELTTVHASVANQKTLAPGSKQKDSMSKLSMKEDLQVVFGKDDLSEEFVEKASTLFEAAVESRLVEARMALEEEYEEKLQTSINEATEMMTENLSKYLDYVAEQWVEKNEIEIKRGLQLESMESFMKGLRNLFVEHYIDIPAEKEDVVEALSNEVEELKARLNESINENVELSNQIKKNEKLAVVSEVSEGLTDTQADKLKVMAESVSFETIDEFKGKLNLIKESFLTKKEVSSGQQQLSEEVEVDSSNGSTKRPVDPTVSRYMEAISRTLKK